MPHAFGKRFGQQGHHRPNIIGQIHGIGPRRLVKGNNGTGFAVHARKHIVGLHAQFHTGHILDFNLGPGICGTNYDIPKGLLGSQPIGQPHGIGKLRPVRCGFRPEFSAGNNDVLGPDGIGNFRHGHVELCQTVWFNPDAHGVVGASQDIHPADALQPRQGILDIDQGIVVQKRLIIFVGRIGESNQHQDVGQRFFRGDP